MTANPLTVSELDGIAANAQRGLVNERRGLVAYMPSEQARELVRGYRLAIDAGLVVLADEPQPAAAAVDARRREQTP